MEGLGEHYIFGVILLIIVFMGIWKLFFNRRSKIRRKIKKAPLLEMDTAKEGEEGKIIGDVVIYKNELISPLSGVPCVYYQVKVERKSNSKNSSWDTIIFEGKSKDFLVTKGEHKALIRMQNYAGFLFTDKKYNSGFLNDTTQNLEAFLKKYDYESVGSFGFNKNLRYKESYLKAGDTVGVKGTVSWESADKKLRTERSGQYLVLHSGEGKLYISDDPKVTLDY